MRLHRLRSIANSLPQIEAHTNADTPELICTTVPPAKSKQGMRPPEKRVEQAALAPHHVGQRKVDDEAATAW